MQRDPGAVADVAFSQATITNSRTDWRLLGRGREGVQER
jgi:hypothetical protein